MLKTRTGGAAAVVLAAVTCAHAQDAVQWPVEDGGNGHWYQAFRDELGVCWHEASNSAESMGGYLATITSEGEQVFVQFPVDLVTPRSPAPEEGGPFLGATCEGAAWGDWSWVTGEPFVYTAWAAGEPNSGGSERFLHLRRWDYTRWNDTLVCSPGMFSYLVEWSADCNGDGIVDYGQILDGTYADEDGNGVPDCCESDCSGDLNGDDSVGPPDLGILLAVWGTDGGKISGADLNGDGIVNAADLGLLVGAWGDCGCN